jgi:hypothetical protein
MMRSYERGYSMRAGRLIGLCGRCRTRYTDATLCDPCLQSAEADVAEKRRIMLWDAGAEDALSALA